LLSLPKKIPVCCSEKEKVRWKGQVGEKAAYFSLEKCHWMVNAHFRGSRKFSSYTARFDYPVQS